MTATATEIGATRTAAEAHAPAGGAAAAPVQALRDRLPRLAHDEAAALRRLFYAPSRYTVYTDAGDAFFTLGPVLGPDGPGETVGVQAEDTTLALRLHRDGHALALEARAWSDYEGPSRVLAWTLAHEPLLALLGQALGVEPLPLQFGDTDGSAAGTLWLSFAFDGPAPGTRSAGRLRLPLAWLERLETRSAIRGVDLAPWTSLPSVLALRLAGPLLAHDAWRALRAGDVIVLGVRTQQLSRVAAVPKYGGSSWQMRALDRGWRCDGVAPQDSRLNEEVDMNEARNPAPAEDEGGGEAVVRALPVRLDFELGQVELTLGEIAALQPGYVFDLPSQLEGANVTIRANGRAVGRGEMVAVGDTLGVRLLGWTAGTGTP